MFNHDHLDLAVPRPATMGFVHLDPRDPSETEIKKAE